MNMFIKEKDFDNAIFITKYGDFIKNNTIRRYRGIDILLPCNTPIISPLDGYMHFIGQNSNSYGYYAVIVHPEYNLYTMYSHLYEKPLLKEGTFIKKGQQFGISGKSGNCKQPHIHFEIHENKFLFEEQIINKDTSVDPLYYIIGLNEFFGKSLKGFKVIDTDDEDFDGPIYDIDDWKFEGVSYLMRKGIINSPAKWRKKIVKKKTMYVWNAMALLCNVHKDLSKRRW